MRQVNMLFRTAGVSVMFYHCYRS